MLSTTASNDDDFTDDAENSKATFAFVNEENQEVSATGPSAEQKKKPRRTKEEIEADRQKQASVKAQKLFDRETAAAQALKKKEVKMKTDAPTTITMDDEVYKLVAPRTPWTLDEKKALVDSYRELETEKEKSVKVKSTSQTKVWLEIIPKKMGKFFGAIRTTPNSQVGASPYKSQLQSIKALVSDYNFNKIKTFRTVSLLSLES